MEVKMLNAPPEMFPFADIKDWVFFRLNNKLYQKTPRFYVVLDGRRLVNALLIEDNYPLCIADDAQVYPVKRAILHVEV
jgi:hypothetical protein